MGRIERNAWSRRANDWAEVPRLSSAVNPPQPLLAHVTTASSSQISAPEHPHRRQRSRPCICASPATEQVPFTKCMRATLAAIVHAVDGGAPCTAPIAYYLSAGPCEHRWTHGLSTIGGRCSPEATGIPSSGEGPTAAPHHHRIVSNKAAMCARRRPHVSLIRSSPRRRYAR